MIGTDAFDAFRTRVLNFVESDRQLWDAVHRVLTFSPADDEIAYGKKISVSIEKSRLSVVSASRFLSRVWINRFSTYPLGDEKYHEGRDHPHALLNYDIQLPRASGNGVTLCVPKSWVVVRTVELPPVVKEDLAGVVAYELDRLTPFGQDEAYYDFQPLEEKENKLTVLIAAAPAAPINRYIEWINSKGFQVERVTFNLSAGSALCRYIYCDDDFIFLEADSSGYEGALFKKGSMRQAFSGKFAGADPRSMAGEIISELDAIAGSQGRAVRVAASLKDGANHLKEPLRASLRWPLDLVEEAGHRFSKNLREGLSYAAAGSAIESLWPGSRALNLLSKDHRSSHKAPVTLTTLLVLAFFALTASNVFVPIIQEEKKLAKINSVLSFKLEEAKKVDALRKEIDNIQGEIARVNDFKNRRRPANAIFKELSKGIPNSAWLTRMRISESKLEIEGYASSATAILTSLEASDYFAKAEFASPIYKDVKRNAERFTMRMEMEGASKANEGKGR
jgi:Tfp pilus assembly protein PilN